MSCSTAATKGCSSCFQSWTDPRIRRHMARGSSTPSAAHTPVFQSCPFGTTGHASMPTADRSHRLPHVDVGRSGHEHVRVAHRFGQARFLAARDQVVEEHAEAVVPVGIERAHLVGQVVGAVEALDHDPLDAQIVAPDPLDQLGVVHALDPDPAAARDARLGADDGAAPRRGPRRRRRRGGRRRPTVSRTGTRCVGVPSTAKVPGRLR